MVALERALKERDDAVRLQAASAKILVSLRASRHDPQPVFDAIVENVRRLFDTRYAVVFLLKGDQLDLVAVNGDAQFAQPGNEAARRFRESFPQPVDPDSFTGKALRSGRVMQLAPIAGNPRASPRAVALAKTFGYDSIVMAPLVKDGRVIGAIGTNHPQPRRYSTKELSVFRAFADQAVIAIENARLFNETKEALEQQTAIGDILRATSTSPTDLRDVFEVVLANAIRLCEGDVAVLWRYDGSQLCLAAHKNASPGGAAYLDQHPLPLGTYNPTPRAGLERRVVHELDVFANADYRPLVPRGQPNTQQSSTQIAVPLLREGALLGVITVWRFEKRPFNENQVALLGTFADQAALAIENVRLFNETKEALEQQSATGEVLASISSAIADTQPVFDAIVKSVRRLFSTPYAVVALLEHDMLVLKATAGDERFMASLKASYPWPASDDGMVASRAIRTANVVQLAPIANNPLAPSKTAELAKAIGYDSILVAPLMREGTVIGYIAAPRVEPTGFDDKQVALIKSFADQAVIAIENARLFNETKEALERQTATSEILQVIGRSMSNTQPVFEAIVKNCGRLFADSRVSLWLIDGEQLGCRASSGFLGAPMPVDGESAMGACVLEQRVIHLADLDSAAERYPRIRQLGLKHGYRSGVYAPLLREGAAVGGISVLRHEAGAFEEKDIALLSTFASQAVIAIENVRLFNELQTRNRALTEALEQQIATAEILRVISSSPTDIRPVLRAVAENAARLCNATDVIIRQLEGEVLRAVEHIGPIPLPGNTLAPRLSANTIAGRAVLEGRTIHIHDVHTPEVRQEYPEAMFLLHPGVVYHTLLDVPMMREGQAIGVIVVRRAELAPFSDQQIKLLETFADQAVIAIENVRLFNETKEALARQTATAEVLRVISGSLTDTQPVFDIIAQRAARLTGATIGWVFMYDGEWIRPASSFGLNRAAIDAALKWFPMRPSGASYTARAIRDRQVVNVADAVAETDPEYQTKPVAAAAGYRSVLSVPMLREQQVVGAISVNRAEPGLFSDKEVELLRTFADQAVIAIENVRLFNETKEALEKQTATSELLRVIGRSAFDLRPVFSTLAESAVRLCAAERGLIFRFDGQLLRIAAGHNVSPELRDFFERHPMAPGRHANAARAALERKTVHNIDVRNDPEYTYGASRVDPYRTVLAVPMLKGDDVLGVIVIYRHEVRPFSDDQIGLVETFAAQAVIAIENVRLFNETKEALEQQTATAEVLKLISRTTFELDKVLQALLDNATRLSGATRAAMLRPDGEGNYLPTVTYRYELPMLSRMRERPIRAGRDSINGRALLEKRAIHVPDVLADPEYGRQDLMQLDPYRTVLAVPMLRDGDAVGLITLTKGAEVDPFTEKQMEVVTTLADQAVIAIENVRLFNEIQEKSAQLEVANKHKSDFLANMSHELRTPLNAIIGFSEVLIEKMFGEVNDKQLDYLKDIHESGKHLLSLINDILDLSKIEAGRMELELSRFDLPSAIGNAMTLVRERAQRHGIKLGQEIDPRLGEFQGDERKVKQILLNLLSNAVKFTPDGGRVDVAARLDTTHVEIAVRDTGVGIAPDDQAALFEEFRQVGRDSLRKAEGTGLGLALTKKFVELHGGAIRVQSAPGSGSTFTVSLPLR